jgi:hypothetical protein
MSPPEQRRKHDNLPPEVKDYIDAAAEAGAEKAILKLYAEIGKTGVRKAALIIGAAVLGVLSYFGLYHPK